MGLRGKIVRKIDVEMSRDTIFQIYRERTNDFAKMCPVVQGVDLLSGEWGTVGSVILWRLTDQDGKQRTAKEVIESIDIEKKSMTFKVIDSDLLRTFKSFKFIFQGETDEKNSVALTLEYEKMTENVEEPEWMMDLWVQAIKAVNAYHLQCQ